MSSDPMKQAWNDVAEGFSTLGGMMKERYQGASEDKTGDTATAGGESDAGAALRDAFDRLVAAGRELGDRAADVAGTMTSGREPSRAATSLNNTLSATVELIGDEVGGFFRRSRGDGSSPGITGSEPPTDDARQ